MRKEKKCHCGGESGTDTATNRYLWECDDIIEEGARELLLDLLLKPPVGPSRG